MKVLPKILSLYPITLNNKSGKTLFMSEIFAYSENAAKFEAFKQFIAKHELKLEVGNVIPIRNDSISGVEEDPFEENSL